MTSFPQFASLPLELQREVWQASLDEAPEPGVHVFRTEDPGNGDPASITIDISLNTLMHVCRESRIMARRQLKFRRVDRGACLDPYRAFDAETDSMYISTRDWASFFCAESFASWTAPAASLRHLALDARAGEYGVDGVSMFIHCLGVLGGLRTVSIVFSDEGWVPRDHVPSGDLQYRLVDCVQGDAVWHAPPSRVKRQDMDPWDIARDFRRAITGYFMQPRSREGIPDWEHAAYDQTTREFLFDIIPRRIVPRREGIRRGVEEQSDWISSIITDISSVLTGFRAIFLMS